MKIYAHGIKDNYSILSTFSLYALRTVSHHVLLMSIDRPFPFFQIVSRNPYNGPLLKKDGKPMGGSTIFVGTWKIYLALLNTCTCR
jgi:hypothetical protein